MGREQGRPPPLNGRPPTEFPGRPLAAPNLSPSPPFAASYGPPPFTPAPSYSSPPPSQPSSNPTPRPPRPPHSYPSPPQQQQLPSIPMGPPPPIGHANRQLHSPTVEHPPPVPGQHSQRRAGGTHPPVGPPRVHEPVEDFSSLSVVDPEAVLPRPLGGDVEGPTPMYSHNCHSRYFRLTTGVVPNSRSLLSRWHFPLGAVVHPLAETPDGEEIPIVNFGPAIVRCRNSYCRAYVNPYVKFVDSGRRWCCNMCRAINDVPGDYFSLLDASGQRCDADQRPELSKGSVEFVAPEDYMNRPPMPPLYFFLIDVSFYAVRSGMLEVVVKTIKSCLDMLPGFPRTQIGFITYDSALHFYNMRSSLTQPQMMVVSDLEDIIVPLPDDLLVNLSKSRNVVDAFLDSLPSMFKDSVNIESAFGPALKAALMVMSQLGGKLLIFQSTLPSLGVGRLKQRGGDVCMYGTDEEPAIRVTQDLFYKQMATDLTMYHIGVNVYAFSEKYTDIASLGTLAKYTGGQVNYYPCFQEAVHGEKLRHDLARDLTRETAWEAWMLLRCGPGVRVSTYHGYFMLKRTGSVHLPAVDCDKAFAVEIALEESLLSTQTIYFQFALLYTSSSGERRIRVHTAAAPVVQELGEMYRYADTGAIVSVLSRVGIQKSLFSKLEDARHAVQLKIVKGLKEYRNLCAMQHRLTGRIIFPESLKYLLLYGLAISKSIALRGGFPDGRVDERCAAGYSMMTLSVKKLLKFLYPSLSRIDEYLLKGPTNIDDVGSIVKPLPLTSTILDPRGLYLFDDGFRFIIWFGYSLTPVITFNLVGADLPDMSRETLSKRDNNTSRKLSSLLKRIREIDPSSYQLCHLVRQGEPRENILLSNLIDDSAGGIGYVEYIQQIHRQMQQGI